MLNNMGKHSMLGIGFSNMKVFANKQWFDFRKLTLLTGTNNSGKSSVINAMKLIQSSMISCKSIDDLLRLEIKVDASLENKHGSLMNFVNNKAKGDRSNRFGFSFQNMNYIYSIIIKIEEGTLNSYGKVEEILVHDKTTKQLVFRIKHKNKDGKSRFRNYIFKINYDFFVTRFYQKRDNTLKLHERKKELDDLVIQVNENKVDLEELNSLCDKLSKEFSVSIKADSMYSYDIGEITDDTAIEDLPVNVELSIKPYEKSVITSQFNYIDEMGPLFTPKKDLLSFVSLFSNEELKSFDNIFDFSFLWEKDSSFKNRFVELLSTYYKETDFNILNRQLNKDLIHILSNTEFDMMDNEYSNFPHENIFLIKYYPTIGFFGLLYVLYEPKTRDDLSFRKFIDSELFEDEKFKNMFSSLSNLILEFSQQSNVNRNNIKFIKDPLWELINNDIKEVFYGDFQFRNEYLSSNRFRIERSYSFNDSSDFSITLKQIEKLSKDNQEKSYKFINKWLNEFKIADELVLNPVSDTGKFKAFLKKDDLKISIADYGLGTNQLLPIIFSLAKIPNYYNEIEQDYIIRPRTIVIEEPEANLHPALQSKLADMFVEALNQFNLQIIVETHSEYLIRKLQYLSAKYASETSKTLSINPNDINIYYFNSDECVSEKETKVKKIQIDEFGGLSDTFGEGFFDEATNLKFQLIRLNKSQSN